MRVAYIQQIEFSRLIYRPVTAIHRPFSLLLSARIASSLQIALKAKLSFGWCRRRFLEEEKEISELASAVGQQKSQINLSLRV